jgi:hypothetical protein
MNASVREFAHREQDGLEVTLFGTVHSNRVSRCCSARVRAWRRSELGCRLRGCLRVDEIVDDGQVGCVGGEEWNAAGRERLDSVIHHYEQTAA